MSLTISQVTDPSELDKIIPMDYDAWQVPYNPQLKHFRPAYLNRSDSIAYTTAKYSKKLQENDPNHFMIKVTDNETDEVIGFAIWQLNPMDGQGDGKTVASWYPEGSEEKEFAECFIDGLWSFLAQRVERKHMGNLRPSYTRSKSLCLPLSRSSFNRRSSFSPSSWRRAHDDSLGYQQG